MLSEPGAGIGHELEHRPAVPDVGAERVEHYAPGIHLPNERAAHTAVKPLVKACLLHHVPAHQQVVGQLGILSGVPGADVVFPYGAGKHLGYLAVLRAVRGDYGLRVLVHKVCPDVFYG